MKNPIINSLVLCAVFSLSIATTQAIVPALTGPISNPANGHNYFLLDTSNWTASEAQAQAMGGHLVTINNNAEDAWVFSTFFEFRRINTRPLDWTK